MKLTCHELIQVKRNRNREACGKINNKGSEA
jgi:hypothetical protein